MRPDIEDLICITIPGPEETLVKRWWEIRQPPPSIAFSLQGHLASALGTGVYDAIINLLRRTAMQEEGNPEEEKIKDFIADQESLGEAEALRIYRRARCGQSLVSQGEPLETASERLRIAMNFVARKSGVHLAAPILLGEAERDQDSRAGLQHKWSRPALLHRLLLASELKFGGTADRPRFASGSQSDDAEGAELSRAVNKGSIGGFVKALDEVLVSADELGLLATWATIHLFRPF
jgi:hypothetical protein